MKGVLLRQKGLDFPLKGLKQTQKEIFVAVL